MWKKPRLLAISSCISAAVLAGLAGAEVPTAQLQDGWRVALPGWRYEFPRDHRAHRDFKTEWWYFTGNLESESGRAMGFQLTFFRQGVIPPGERQPVRSRFVVEDIAFVHFAISDLEGGTFFFDHAMPRGAFGEVAFGDEEIVRIGSSSLRLREDGGFQIVGKIDSTELRLDLTPEKSAVFHGTDGVSQKAEGSGRASHYYSFTRLRAEGEVRVDGETHRVRGWSWYDHEWATNQLTENQVGWDWFSLQLDDGSELMLFQIRTRDGGRDPFSSGTLIAPDGTVTAVRNEDFELEPERYWRSRQTGARYPVGWTLRIPKLDLSLSISSRLDRQELVLTPISYWEGAVRAVGTRGNRSLAGAGYLEMTGYAGPIVGMQAAIE